ncbi:MAG: archease [Candidatus Bathyarchaeota archaeon]|nr:archease [Candidatus Bathyarchaeota archaeon]
MMIGYTYPDEGPTADLLVEATGATLEEAFANLAFGMLNAMTPIEGIKEKEEFTLEAKGEDMESLLFNLMDEFLYINDVEFLVPRSIEMEIDTENYRAVAKCRGERFSRDTHEIGVAVKAVTFHMMEIKQETNGWRVRTVFDT